MAAFDYERTWSFAMNQAKTPAVGADESKVAAWALGAMLLGNTTMGSLGGGGNWTLVRSCNSLVDDTSDNLHLTGSGAYTVGDWVFGANGTAVHSYYVLQSPVMANGLTFYMSVSLNASGANTCSVKFALAPFDAGTTNTDPVSVDSWTTLFSTSGGTGGVHRYSMGLSSTGDFYFIVVIAGGGNPAAAVMCVAPVGTHALDRFPLYTLGLGPAVGTSGALRAINIAATTSVPTKMADGAAGGLNIIQLANPVQVWSTGDLLTGKYLGLPCWVIVQAAASPVQWHHRGRLPDILWSGNGNASNAPTNGQTIVNGVSAVVASTLGCFVFPANAAFDMS